jgi:hypothetical protein
VNEKLDFQRRITDPLPREFKNFRDYHAGENILVCGCGSSLSRVVAPERVVTIGVNDVGRLFDPDYLVVLNPRQQFTQDRWSYVEQSRARAVFSQLDLGITHPHQVRVELGIRGGTDFSNPNLLPYTRNSPYPALCLAVHMGARRIGLIGVDFTDNHFFAATGRHSLAGEFPQIEREYCQLQQSCARRGVEVFNLGAASRLTAFPKMTPEDFMESAVSPRRWSRQKLFFVHHHFVTCGKVFEDGLAHAADQLGLEPHAAYWDDPQLPERVESVAPDLLFVVNGRRFAWQWGKRFAKNRSAVWLLDEPYEVDDTSKFSSLFNMAFVNDPNTLERHSNACYLPTCYDPRAHFYRPAEPRSNSVGFIGFAGPERERGLARLAQRGMLSYTVGGPWADAAVRRLSRPKISAKETAEFYRNTRVVLNFFRSRHHYNNCGIPASALNPRIYEALGCGALVISEHRPELDTLCPELPVFRSVDEMELLVQRFLQDEKLFAQVRKACIRRLAKHTYAARLSIVLSKCFAQAETISDFTTKSPSEVILMSLPDRGVAAAEMHSSNIAPVSDLPKAPSLQPLPPELAADWEVDSACVRLEPDGSFTLQKAPDESPGSERGFVGKASLRNLCIEFDLQLHADSHFVAKIHQAEASNQLSNSYHLMCRGSRAYLARHSKIFCHLMLPLDTWFRLAFSYSDGAIVLRKNGAQIAQLQERNLEAGHCFLGVKGGTVRLRELGIATPDRNAVRTAHPEYEVLRRGMQRVPRVSIVTTVYDRVKCLEYCLQSVQALNFKDHEHIIVADSPPSDVLRQIEAVVDAASVKSERLTLATLKTRKNDWGISPAAAGLAIARGEYVCFLSDDNGYVPSHFDKLVVALDQDPHLGFVYSSCLYAGRAMLRTSAPTPGKIDLGQPLFRRELFDRYLGGTLPFHEFVWDWKMIEAFLQNGVRWRHVDDATFVFRLANYPHLLPRMAGAQL